MSGIAGILQFDGEAADPSLVRRMTEALAHRGPDGEGFWARGPIAFGHRLAATTPESRFEKQPVTDERGECCLVWDGRLDNREALAAALGSSGRPISGVTDPELALAAYREWGRGCLERLSGDFAFAVWDQGADRLLCVRDALGVKPFCYHWDGHRLLFGSEASALFTDPTIVRQPNEAMIADYLLGEFRDAEATFFDAVKQLPPGHWLSVGRGGMTRHRYWDIDPSREIRYPSAGDYLDAFRELFTEAVRARLRSAGPVAMLLSGGIDSSAVAAVAETLRGSVPLIAFTAVGEGFLKEEWDAVRGLVERWGTELHTVTGPGPEAMGSALDFTVDGRDAPSGFVFPTVPLAHAAGRGCAVALTGFGSDQLFYLREVGFLADLARRRRLLALRQHARWASRAYGYPSARATLRSAAWLALSPTLRRHFKRLTGHDLPAWVDRDFARRTGLHRRVVPTRRRFEALANGESYRMLAGPAMAIALGEVDDAGARFGLECRHPYLDRRLVEFLFAVPPAVTMQWGYRKQFLQRALRDITGPPRERETSEMLQPFDASAAQVRDEDRLEHTLRPEPAHIFDYIDRAALERLRRRYRGGDVTPRILLWRCMALEKWLRTSRSEPSPQRGNRT